MTTLNEDPFLNKDNDVTLEEDRTVNDNKMSRFISGDIDQMIQ
jgi:hypothetical protein